VILGGHFFNIFRKKVVILGHDPLFSKKSDFNNFSKNDDCGPPKFKKMMILVPPKFKKMMILVPPKFKKNDDFFDNFFMHCDFHEKWFCVHVCHKMVTFLQKMSKK